MNAVASPCVVCGGTSQYPFLEISDVPTNCSALWSSPAQARAVPRGNLRLTYCPSCSLVRNAAFDSSAIGYSELYDNSLDFSAAFRSYEQELIGELAARWSLGPGSHVLEVGCGKGEFLAALCELTGATGVGFDPSYVPRDSENKRVRFVIDLYDERYASERADLVICRHVLEHIDLPRCMLRSLNSALKDHPGAGLYIEVPDAAHLFASDEMWDLVYPHCSYFDGVSLRAALAYEGFEVLASASTFGDQFLYAHASPAASALAAPPVPPVAAAVVSGFGRRFQERVDMWADRLRTARARDERVAIWGAGAKCNTFVNVVPGAAEIRSVVDVNPRKTGTYLAGTGQLVGPPRSLIEVAPDLVIVMNPVYLEEIKASLETLAPAAEAIPV